MAVNLKAELEASKSLVELLELAERTRQLYLSARLPLPDPLRRLLGNNGLSSEVASQIQPKVPPMPQEADTNWAWIAVHEASPTSLIKAILRGSNVPLRSKSLYERIVSMGANASLGTVSNAAVRLEDQGILGRDESQQWSLAKPNQAGVLHEGYVWGPSEIFSQQELASNRREAILQILSVFSDGLQMTQITEQLRRLDWVRAPVNKDLVKADMDSLLGAHKVKRKMGHSRKWELVRE